MSDIEFTTHRLHEFSAGASSAKLEFTFDFDEFNAACMGGFLLHGKQLIVGVCVKHGDRSLTEQGIFARIDLDSMTIFDRAGENELGWPDEQNLSGKVKIILDLDSVSLVQDKSTLAGQLAKGKVAEGFDRMISLVFNIGDEEWLIAQTLSIDSKNPQQLCFIVALPQELDKLKLEDVVADINIGLGEAQKKGGSGSGKRNDLPPSAPGSENDEGLPARWARPAIVQRESGFGGHML